MPSVSTSTPSPISSELAFCIGCDCASEWFNRADSAVIPASSTAWRARCLADLVQDTYEQADFLPVLVAWEQGFDTTLAAAVAPVRGRHKDALPFDAIVDQVVFKIGDQQRLLRAMYLLPPPIQQGVLAICVANLNEAVSELAALLGGAT